MIGIEGMPRRDERTVDGIGHGRGRVFCVGPDMLYHSSTVGTQPEEAVTTLAPIPSHVGGCTTVPPSPSGEGLVPSRPMSDSTRRESSGYETIVRCGSRQSASLAP